MARIKSDPVTKATDNQIVKPKPTKAVSSGSEAASANSSSLPAWVGTFKVGSLANITTAGFATKAFLYSVLAVSVVGATAIVASDQVSTFIRNQESPVAARAANILGDEELVVVDEESDNDEEISNEIVIDTSDWVEYSNSKLGIKFMHPADTEVEFNEGDQNNPDSLRVLDGLLNISDQDYSQTLIFFNSNNPTPKSRAISLADNRNVEFSSFTSGDGAPVLDDEGNTICVSGGGTIVDYAEIDNFLVNINTNFSVTDCNDEKKTVRSETSPTLIKTAEEIVKTMQVFQRDVVSGDLYEGDLFSFEYNGSIWTVTEVPWRDQYAAVEMNHVSGTTVLIALDGDFGIGFGPHDRYTQDLVIDFLDSRYETVNNYILDCSDSGDNCEGGEFSSIPDDRLISNSFFQLTTNESTSIDDRKIFVRVINRIDSKLEEYNLDEFISSIDDLNNLLSGAIIN